MQCLTGLDPTGTATAALGLPQADFVADFGTVGFRTDFGVTGHAESGGYWQSLDVPLLDSPLLDSPLFDLRSAAAFENWTSWPALETPCLYGDGYQGARDLPALLGSPEAVGDRLFLGLHDKLSDVSFPEPDPLTGLNVTTPLPSSTTRAPANLLSALPLIETYKGELSPDDDYNSQRQARYKDDFALSIGVDSRIQLSLTASEFDPYLQLIDEATDTVIAFDDDSGPGLNAALNLTVAAGDRLIVRVTSYDPYERGRYRLSLQSAPLDPTALPPPLTPSAAFSGVIDATRPPDPEQFRPTTGYGLANAAIAVQAALNLGQPEPRDPLEAIADLGSDQWALELLQVPEVWAQGFTGAGVVVAVIDSGLDLSHPELQGSLWTNPGEIPGDGIDNDENGYVDDVYGWNFGTGQWNNNVLPGAPFRFQGHGTHVAGIIAGANDGQGNTGVAYDAQIMTLRLGDTNEAGIFVNPGDLPTAIRYAVDNGAHIINLSLGWSDSPDLPAALQYAAARNVVVVSASGNSGASRPAVPARYALDWGVSVGAVTRSGDLATFSNGAGQNAEMLHILAPGTQIYSAEPGGDYEIRSGTSMAAPHISGLVALMLSANPTLTASQVRNILAQSAAPLGPA